MTLSVCVLTQFGEDPVATLNFLESSDGQHYTGSGSRVLLEADGTTCALLDTSGLGLPRSQQEMQMYQVTEGTHVATAPFAKVRRAGDGHFLVSTLYSSAVFNVHIPIQPGAIKTTMFHNSAGQPLARCEQEQSRGEVTY